VPRTSVSRPPHCIFPGLLQALWPLAVVDADLIVGGGEAKERIEEGWCGKYTPIKILEGFRCFPG
jgi:hypothetical protein